MICSISTDAQSKNSPEKNGIFFVTTTPRCAVTVHNRKSETSKTLSELKSAVVSPSTSACTIVFPSDFGPFAKSNTATTTVSRNVRFGPKADM